MSAKRNQSHRPFRRPAVPDLPAALHELLAQIPRGRVTTFGALGTALGAVQAARWVATYLSDVDRADTLPAHRVVLRDGTPGASFKQRPDELQRRLRAEGVPWNGDRVDLTQRLFTEFTSSHPLADLRRVQSDLLADLRLEAPSAWPELVGGVDVSYASPVEAIAAYTLVDVQTGVLVWSTLLRQRVSFPYIPGYLSFRELPLLLDLLEQAQAAGQLAEVILVDGAGILHHRHAGIATHLGIAARLSTIGVSKKRLCGQVDLAGMQIGEARPVIHQEQTVAMALQTRARGGPIYISPGQQVDVPFAMTLVRDLCRGERLPRPTHWAHQLSRAAAMKPTDTEPPG